MENRIEPVHDLSLSASGAVTNSKIVYAHGRRQIASGPVNGPLQLS